MIALKEGEKRSVKARVRRLAGAGAIALTSPQRRILDANLALITGFDWATATWDPDNEEISTLFDSTVAGLSAPATYYVQLRGTIGAELYAIQIAVIVNDWGP